MLLTFASADQVQADYVSVLGWGAFVIIVTMVILGYANKGTQSEIGIASSVKLGVLFFLLLAIVSYRATYGSFIQADIGEHEARLSFAGSLYHTAILDREQIREVRVGYPGKGEHRSCYIEFVTTSDESHRSSATEGKACEGYRVQVNALMRIR